MATLEEVAIWSKKIADSTTMNWIYRGGMIIACGMIVYFSKGTYETVQQHTTSLTAQNGDIGTIKNEVHTIKSEVDGDHDAVTILKVQMDNVATQIQKLWERPSQPPKRTP